MGQPGLAVTLDEEKSLFLIGAKGNHSTWMTFSKPTVSFACFSSCCAKVGTYKVSVASRFLGSGTAQRWMIRGSADGDHTYYDGLITLCEQSCCFQNDKTQHFLNALHWLWRQKESPHWQLVKQPRATEDISFTFGPWSFRVWKPFYLEIFQPFFNFF